MDVINTKGKRRDIMKGNNGTPILTAKEAKKLFEKIKEEEDNPTPERIKLIKRAMETKFNIKID